MRSLVAITAALVAGLLWFPHRNEQAGKQRPTGGPIPPSYFGMTVNAPLSTPWPAIAFGSLRTWDMGISWSDIAVGRGRYDWRKFDAIVDQAKRHGVQLVYTFGRTPRWAARNPDAHGAYGPGQCSPPAKISDWEDFVRAAVHRAAGRIKFWEIWNEPQDPNFYCGDIPTIVSMEKAAYEIIKSQGHELQVLTPSPTGGLGPSWMLRFLSAGGGDYADVLAFHGYWDAEARSLPAVVSRFQISARLGGQGRKPMWDTEASWGQDPPGMDQAQKAAFLAKYYLLHWSLGIQRLYWYSYDNKLGWGTLWDRKRGLLLPGTAYGQVRSWMLGARMDRRCAPDGTPDPVWICGFARRAGYRALAVWTQGAPCTYRVDRRFVSYRDLVGRRHEVRNGEVTINTSPILLETIPSRP